MTYLPFIDGQWHLNLGLKAPNIPEWIDIAQHFIEELSLKEKLPKNQYSDVFASIPKSQSSQQEVLDLLLNHLLDYFPQYYQQQSATIKNLCTSQLLPLADFEAAPLGLAGCLGVRRLRAYSRLIKYSVMGRGEAFGESIFGRVERLFPECFALTLSTWNALYYCCNLVRGAIFWQKLPCVFLEVGNQKKLGVILSKSIHLCQDTKIS